MGYLPPGLSDAHESRARRRSAKVTATDAVGRKPGEAGPQVEGAGAPKEGAGLLAIRHGQRGIGHVFDRLAKHRLGAGIRSRRGRASVPRLSLS